MANQERHARALEIGSTVPAIPKLASLMPWLTLLGLSVLINYIDRGNLAIAAPLLEKEMHITAWQLGILLSAFFWTYTALQFVMGWVVDRFDVNLVIAAGYLVWSVCTAATGLVQGFGMLLVMRLMLGVGESVVFPSCSKVLAVHVPEIYRGFANGVLMAGLKCGPAVGSLGAGLLMAKYGWRPVFIGIGLLSLVWLPMWIRWMPRGKAVTRSAVAGVPTVKGILRQRSFWGVSAGHFSGAYFLYVMISWLPFYLAHERHLSMATMAKVAAIYFVADAAAAVGTGWITDAFVRRGHTPTVVRKSAMVVGHTAAAIGLAGCAVAGPTTYLAWLMLAGIGSGISISGLYAFSQILAGPKAAGRWTGLQNGFGNFSGPLAPALTGFAISWTGNFRLAFTITAAVSLVGAAAWIWWVGPLEQVNWAEERSVLLDPARETP
jgi:MFS family permease